MSATYLQPLRQSSFVDPIARLRPQAQSITPNAGSDPKFHPASGVQSVAQLKSAEMSTQVLAVAALVLATFGVVLVLLGGILVRAGTLPQSYEASVTYVGEGYGDIAKLYEVVIAFERELVVDAGGSLTNIANILLYATVIASIAIALPSWSYIMAAALLFALLWAAFAFVISMDQLVRKRTRQQNVFDLVRQSGFTKIVDYFLERHPSLGFWKTLNWMQKAITVAWQIIYTARWYWPWERQ